MIRPVILSLMFMYESSEYWVVRVIKRVPGVTINKKKYQKMD